MSEKKTALLIMAAGIGSRFGGGIKQLEPVGLHGEIIMDYSIHDAIEAGFNKIVFIIRKDIEKDFLEVIGNRVEKICGEHGVEVCYVFQNAQDIPGEFPEGRTKPWGTGQAVLAAREVTDMPFAVINADDHYGKQAFRKLHNFLIEEGHAGNEFCMAGFVLSNTLSDFGTVTRGVCSMDSAGYLTNIVETKNIAKVPGGAVADGVVLNPGGLVSMNMWGLTVDFMKTLEEHFRTFFEQEVPQNPLKAEYLLPILIGELLQKKEVSVKVLPTTDKWFGVTYHEDKPMVMAAFKELIEKGVYKEDLYSDL